MDACEKESWLSGLLDGELGEAQRQELEGHLKVCAGCRQLLQELRVVEKGLDSVPLPEPDQWRTRWQNVLQAFAEATRPSLRAQTLSLRDRVLGRRARWALALAACLLALVAGGLVVRALLPEEGLRPRPVVRPQAAAPPIELASAEAWEVELDQSEGAPGAVLLISGDGEVAVLWVSVEESPPSTPGI